MTFKTICRRTEWQKWKRWTWKGRAFQHYSNRKPIWDSGEWHGLEGSRLNAHLEWDGYSTESQRRASLRRIVRAKKRKPVIRYHINADAKWLAKPANQKLIKRLIQAAVKYMKRKGKA